MYRFKLEDGTWSENIPTGYTGKVENRYGDIFHHKDGRIHATKHPASIYQEGTFSWVLRGQPHRSNGPARYHKHNYFRQFWRHGKLHNTLGHAVLDDSGFRSYNIQDCRLSPTTKIILVNLETSCELP